MDRTPEGSNGFEADPIWARPLPNLWETLLLNFRRILLGTLVAMVVAAGASLLWPKTYRASSTLAIFPPRYASELEAPPVELAMPSIQAIATSHTVLQDVLADLSIKRLLTRRIREIDPLLAEGISSMSAATAAAILDVPLTESFQQSWGVMPPAELLPGFEDFRDRDLERLDAIELSKRLTASIRTSLETNLTTQYQPLLTLSAEWRTPRSAALLAHLWAGAALRALERDVVRETIAIGAEKARQVEWVRENHRNARSAPHQFLAFHPLDVRRSEARSLARIEGSTGLSEEDRTRSAELDRWIGKAEGELEAIRKEWERSASEFDYTLDRMGGIEALVEDYPAILRAKLLGPPTPPIQKIRPRRSAVVLAVGMFAFLALSASAQMREIRREVPPRHGADRTEAAGEAT